MTPNTDKSTETDSTAAASRRRFLQLTAVGAVAGATGFATAAAQQQQPEPVAEILLGGRVEAWQGRAPPAIAGQDNPTLNLIPGEVYQLVWMNLDGQPHNFAIQNAEGDNLQVLLPIEVQPDQVTFPEANVTTNQTANATAGNDTAVGDAAVNDTGAMNDTGVTNDTAMNATNATDGMQTLEGELVEQTETISEEGAVQGVQFVATQEMASYICLIHPTTMVGDVSLTEDGLQDPENVTDLGNATNATNTTE